MDTPKVTVIINPKSGTGKKSDAIEKIDNFFKDKGIRHNILMTEYAGHAEKLAKQYAGQVEIIAAMGGDGTVNEIARSLIGTDTALAIIPSGSGNGLARDLRIPMRLTAALKTITNGEKKTIDYGIINGHPFFCTCGTGFDASVSLKFAGSHKRGFMTYIESTLTEWLNYSPTEYTLTIDNKETRKVKAFLVACANASQYGNNAYIAPQADLTDGVMDVTILEPFSVIDIPGLVIQLFTKTLDKSSHIKTFRCSRLHISSENENPSHFDGDPIILDKDIDIEIIGKKLNVIVPNKKDLNNRFRYTLSQRYDITLRDLQHCAEYIDDVNNRLSRQISENNETLVQFVKKTNEDIKNRINKLINKK